MKYIVEFCVCSYLQFMLCLQVLTANIGTLLDLYGVEKGLEHYRSTSDLNFEHFKYYLHKEVCRFKNNSSYE